MYEIMGRYEEELIETIEKKLNIKLPRNFLFDQSKEVLILERIAHLNGIDTKPIWKKYLVEWMAFLEKEDSGSGEG